MRLIRLLIFGTLILAPGSVAADNPKPDCDQRALVMKVTNSILIQLDDLNVSEADAGYIQAKQNFLEAVDAYYQDSCADWISKKSWQASVVPGKQHSLVAQRTPTSGQPPQK